MPTVLIVEDMKMFSNLLKKEISTRLLYDVVQAASLAEAKELLDAGNVFDVALLDLTLPDALDGEVVDLVAPSTPSIVFTGKFNEDTRNLIWTKNIADYVLKEGQHNLDYILTMVERLHCNKRIKTLVVDDSRLQRSQVAHLLRTHRYEVLEAEDGVQALTLLEQNPDVQLMVTDYNMPNMDGFELVKETRRRFTKDELAIIGISAGGDTAISAKFIKNGANDFLVKPFIAEEFYCRVTSSIQTLEHIRQIRDASEKDFLTKLYNRRFFFGKAQDCFANTANGEGCLALAMLDLDKFKAINDTYGHDAGDEVLKHVAWLISARFGGKGIVARLGGEEFCVLLTNRSDDGVDALSEFEALRQSVEKATFNLKGQIVRCTISIGLCARPRATLDETLKAADTLLYRAKDSGRNMIVVDKG